MLASNELLLGWQEYLLEYYFYNEDALDLSEEQEIYAILADIRLAYAHTFNGGIVSNDLSIRVLEILTAYLEVKHHSEDMFGELDLRYIVGKTIVELNREHDDEIDIRLPLSEAYDDEDYVDYSKEGLCDLTGYCSPACKYYRTGCEE